jgi:hypothetical protein
VSEDDEDVEDVERRRRDGEGIDRSQGADVVGQERAPGLRRRLAWRTWHEARHLALGDRDAECAQLAVDAGSAPERIELGHVADEVARVAIDGWTPGRSSRAPGPETPKSRAVPVHDGIRPHGHEGVAPTRPRARQRDPEEAIGPGQGGGDVGAGERRAGGEGRDSRWPGGRGCGWPTWQSRRGRGGTQSLADLAPVGGVLEPLETPQDHARIELRRRTRSNARWYSIIRAWCSPSHVAIHAARNCNGRGSEVVVAGRGIIPFYAPRSRLYSPS